MCLLVSNVSVHSAKKSIHKPVERNVRFTFVDLCNQSLLNLTILDIYLSLQTYLKECAYNQLTQQVLISQIHKSPVEISDGEICRVIGQPENIPLDAEAREAMRESSSYRHGKHMVRHRFDLFLRQLCERVTVGKKRRDASLWFVFYDGRAEALLFKYADNSRHHLLKLA